MFKKLIEQMTTNRWFAVSLAVLAAALAYAFIVINGDRALWSGFTFIMILPILIGSFLSLVTPGEFKNKFRYQFAVQFSVFGILILFFSVVMREGVICILMLVLPWLFFAMVGSYIVFLVQHRIQKGRFFSIGVLLLPIMGLQIEASFAPPDSGYTVSQQVEIDAVPKDIWPLLLTIDHIQKDEGKWNFTQDVVGIARPKSAVLIGSGVGSVRQAEWGSNIQFEEHVTEWKPGHKIAWDFHFSDDSISQYTDRHISPDSNLLTIDRGGYLLEQIAPDRSRLTLFTEYRTQSWMHRYSSFWGQTYLGDIQNNILRIIKDRVERKS